MENNILNKGKFFAQYWNQKVLCFNDEGQYKLGNCYEVDGSVDEHSFLELKSIKNMSLEEAQKYLDTFYNHGPGNIVCDLEFYKGWGFSIIFKYKDNETPEDDEGYSYSSVSIESTNTSYEDVDWFRLNGFAVSWGGLSMEQLIEYGWIKIKEDDTNK